MAEAKTIYGDGHVGHKYVTPSGENDEKVGILLSSLVLFEYFSHSEMLPQF